MCPLKEDTVSKTTRLSPPEKNIRDRWKIQCHVGIFCVVI